MSMEYVSRFDETNGNKILFAEGGDISEPGKRGGGNGEAKAEKTTESSAKRARIKDVDPSLHAESDGDDILTTIKRDSTSRKRKRRKKFAGGERQPKAERSARL